MKHQQFQRKQGASKQRRDTPSVDGSSESFDEDAREEEEEEYDGGETRPTRTQKPRIVKSQKNMVQKPLPFSPRKTRTRGRAVTEDSELSDIDSDSSQPQLRRGTRTRTGKQHVMEADDEDYDGVESDYDDDRDRNRSKKTTKGKPKKKAPKPEYGCVRSVNDDIDDNDEEAILRAHREFCEKCKKSPAHILLKKAKKRGKKKKVDDEFEETEEERAIGLGGWVQWYARMTSQFTNCL